jgi:hypothetical protein
MEIQEQGTMFKKRRRQISVNAFHSGLHTKPELPCRGHCTGWNDRISARAGAYVENFREDFKAFGTLTYPATYPKSGQAVKNHWRAFIERLRRSGWLNDGSIFWWMEFQERGAPHFHFLVTTWIGKTWVAVNWAEITQGNPESCSRVEGIRHNDRIGNYVRKYMQKAEQKEIPSDFVGVGRMWGISGPKFVDGKPRLPVVVATTWSGLPSRYADILTQARCRFRVRIATTQSGFVIYGDEQEINDTWRYLAANIAVIGLTEAYPDTSPPKTSDGWSGMPEQQGRDVRKLKRLSEKLLFKPVAKNSPVIAKNCTCSYHSELRLQ